MGSGTNVPQRRNMNAMSATVPSVTDAAIAVTATKKTATATDAETTMIRTTTMRDAIADAIGTEMGRA
jgi:hypothetical protein